MATTLETFTGTAGAVGAPLIEWDQFGSPGGAPSTWTPGQNGGLAFEQDGSGVGLDNANWGYWHFVEVHDVADPTSCFIEVEIPFDSEFYLYFCGDRGSTADAYFAYFFTYESVVRLRKSSTPTFGGDVANGTNSRPGSGTYIVRVERNGNDIDVYCNGNLDLSYTDPSAQLTGTSMGIWSPSSAASYLSVEAGDIGGAAATSRPIRRRRLALRYR